MCLLIAKPRGVELPPKKYLANGFTANHDGAGFAVAKGRHILIKKGYTSFARFYHELRSSVRKKDGAIIHFRLASHGLKTPGNCHPYPLTDRIELLTATKLRTPLPVVAHNGILSRFNAPDYKLSDTAHFVREVLSQPEIKNNLGKGSIQELIALTGDKFAFMWPDGSILWIGDSIEENGVLYSNGTYMTNWWYGKGWGGYRDDNYISLPSTTQRSSKNHFCEICGRFRDDVVWRSDAGLYCCDDCYLTEVLGFYDPITLKRGVKDREG